MVVMERVEEGKPWSKDATEKQRAALQTVLTLMKDNSFVHGDLRAPNVLLQGTEGIRVIDFEFAGKVTKEGPRLPFNIYEHNFCGRKPLELITFELDADMAGKMLE